MFDPLQEIIQPQIRHVLEIKDELPIKSEDDRDGADSAAMAKAMVYAKS